MQAGVHSRELLHTWLTHHGKLDLLLLDCDNLPLLNTYYDHNAMYVAKGVVLRVIMLRFVQTLWPAG